MLRRITPLLAVAALLLVPAPSGAQDAQTGPRISVPEKVKDFGTVPQGEVLEVKFQLVNEGTETLVIKAVRPTCGCTVAEFDKEIAPGSAGWVRATVDTAAFSGPITKSILVMTNDTETPTVSLVVKANVRPYLEVVPRPLVRFNTVRGEPVSQEVIVVTDDAQDFEVTGVKSSVPYVTGTVRRLEESELVPGKYRVQYGVKLTLAPDAPAGPLNADVMIATTHPKAKEVKVKVFGVVRSLLHVTPSQIQFGSVEARAKPGRNVIVVYNVDKPLSITGVSVDDEAFEAAVLPIEEGKRYQITVTVKPDAKPGKHDAVLVVKTSDPKFKEVRIPVRANIK